MRWIICLWLVGVTAFSQPGTKGFFGFPPVRHASSVTPPVLTDTSCIGCRPLATLIDTTGFVAFWPFDGNTKDTTWNHNDLQYGAQFSSTEPHNGNGLIYGGFGVFGGMGAGGDAGGTTDIAWIEDNPSLDLSGGSWSVGIWNRCAAGNTVYLMSKVRWSTGLEWEIGKNSSGNYFVMIGAGDSVYTSAVTLTSDSSQTACTNYFQPMDLIVAGYDAVTDSLFISVNGGPSKKVACASNIVHTRSPITILARNASGTGYGSRGIDQPFIVKRRLHDGEITSMWNSAYGLTWGFKERPMKTLDPARWAPSYFAAYDSLGMDSTLIYGPPGQEANWQYASYDLFGKVFSNSSGEFSIQRRGKLHVDTSGTILIFNRADSLSAWTHTVFGDSVGIDDRNVAGGRDPGGSTCIVFWHTYTAGQPATGGRTYYRRSTDLGATWLSKQTLEPHVGANKYIVPYGPLTHIGDTLYQAFYNVPDGSGGCPYVYRSTNDGDTWTFLSRIDSLTDVSETAICALRGDTMLAISRYEGKGFRQYSSVDAGHTWSYDGPVAPKQFGANGFTGSYAYTSSISPWLYRNADTVVYYWALRGAFVAPGDKHTLVLGFTSAHVSRVAGCSYNWWHEWNGTAADGPGQWPLYTAYWSKCGGVGGNEGYQSVTRDKWGKLRFSWCQGKGSGEVCIEAPNVYITK